MDTKKPIFPQAANSDRPKLLNDLPSQLALPDEHHDADRLAVEQAMMEQAAMEDAGNAGAYTDGYVAEEATQASAYPFRDNALLGAAIAAGQLRFAPSLNAPCAVSHFATVNNAAPIEADREHLGWLCYSVGAPPPPPDATEHTVEFEGFLVHWENRGAISAYTVVQRNVKGQAFDQLALNGLPEDWLAGLNGVRLFGLHLFYEEATGPERNRASLARLFGRDGYIGTSVAGGKGLLWADWSQADDGFPRILLRDAGLGARTAGRLVMDLVRFEAARMTALTEHARLQALGAQMAVWEQRLQPESGQPSVDAEDVAIVRAGLVRHHADRVALAACDAFEQAARTALVAIDEQRVPGLMPLGDFLGHSLEAVNQDLRQWMARLDLIEGELAKADRHLERDDRGKLTEALQVQTAVMARTAQSQRQNRRLFQMLGFIGLTTAFAFLGQIIGNGLAAAGVVSEPGIVSITAIPVGLLAAYGIIYFSGAKGRS